MTEFEGTTISAAAELEAERESIQENVLVDGDWKVFVSPRDIEKIARRVVELLREES